MNETTFRIWLVGRMVITLSLFIGAIYLATHDFQGIAFIFLIIGFLLIPIWGDDNEEEPTKETKP